MKISNAIISDIDISVRRGCFLEITLFVEADSSCGKINLGYVNIDKNHGFGRIGEVLSLLFKRININKDREDYRFSEFIGQPCRVKSSENAFVAIGHFINDAWIDQDDIKIIFDKYREKQNV